MAPEAGPRYTAEKLALFFSSSSTRVEVLAETETHASTEPQDVLLLLPSGETPATSSTMVPPLAEQVSADMGAEIPRPW